MVIIILAQIQIYYNTGTNDKVKTLCRLFKSFSKKRVTNPELSFWIRILDPFFQAIDSDPKSMQH